jgi:hypothetical protein
LVLTSGVVVESINRINAKREYDKITCQVLLMHRDEDHLRQIYRDLVARGVDTEADPTEASGDFLAKVRVNITAAMRCLDFDDQSVERIFRETHELATWVVNQDELLDRKLLEAQHVNGASPKPIVRMIRPGRPGALRETSSGS